MKFIFARKFVLIAVILLGIVQAVEAEEVYDPLEPMNRGIFWLNDKVDVYFLEPVARGYDAVVPGPIKKGIENFFLNLKYPRYLVSDLIQLKFDQVGLHTGRFFINSTIGVVGFIDIAEDFGLEAHDEDFGLALAYYGVPSGPYLVLPFFGPSNFRDGFGRGVDAFLDPIYAINYTSLGWETSLAISASARFLEAVDTRASLIEAVETAKESSLDYYLFVQSAYYQHRRGVLYDGNPPEEEDEFFDEEEDFEEDDFQEETSSTATD